VKKKKWGKIITVMEKGNILEKKEILTRAKIQRKVPRMEKNREKRTLPKRAKGRRKLKNWKVHQRSMRERSGAKKK